MIGKLQCWLTGKHKWTRISKKERIARGQILASDIPSKRCTRCGLTKSVKSRQQKRDDATKEILGKAKP